MDFEFTVLNWIQTHLRCDFLDWIMPKITALGNAGIFWIVLTLLLLIPKKTRKYALASAIALLLSVLIGNLLLKPLIARTRPFDLHDGISLLIAAPTDFSFPSGHTQASFASAVAFLRTGGKRWGIPLLCLAALIAVSRLYLYVHFPTDILGGCLLGILHGCVGAWLAEKIYARAAKQTPSQKEN